MIRPIVSLCAFFAASIAVAQESGDPKAAVEKTKAALTAAMTKAGIKESSKAETNHLLVYSTLPEAKTKAMAEQSQKVFAFAAKTLKVENADELFPGKLPVLAIPDRKPFANLVLTLSGRRPEIGETYDVRTRGDRPFVAAGLGQNEKEADLPAMIAGWTAVAVLNKKLNTDPGSFDIPEWAQLGFAKAAVLRAEGNQTKLAAYRQKSRSLITGRLRGAVTIKDAWGPSRGKEYDFLAMSVVDFLAFGPDPEKFTKLLQGFKKSDDNRNPTTDSVLTGLEWKWDALDGEWKQYVLKLK